MIFNEQDELERELGALGSFIKLGLIAGLVMIGALIIGLIMCVIVLADIILGLLR